MTEEVEVKRGRKPRTAEPAPTVDAEVFEFTNTSGVAVKIGDGLFSMTVRPGQTVKVPERLIPAAKLLERA